jgi:hypothetical protein
MYIPSARTRPGPLPRSARSAASRQLPAAAAGVIGSGGFSETALCAGAIDSFTPRSLSRARRVEVVAPRAGRLGRAARPKWAGRQDGDRVRREAQAVGHDREGAGGGPRAAAGEPVRSARCVVRVQGWRAGVVGGQGLRHGREEGGRGERIRCASSRANARDASAGGMRPLPCCRCRWGRADGKPQLEASAASNATVGALSVACGLFSQASWRLTSQRRRRS